MDILAALKQEEAKWEKEVSAAQQQLDTVRAAMKLLSGMNGSGKATGSSTAKTTASSSVKTTGAMNSSGKTTGGKKRVMSAAARAKISRASKERWAKFRAAKAKGKN
jgi:hypothetical protein